MINKPPIYSGVKEFISKQKILFTTPGHNGKVILNSKNFCKLDAASTFETDNMDNPKTYILDSELQLTKMYNTNYSFYITNGTSCGLMSMIGSILNPGDKIIVDRICHKAVIDAIMLNSLIPVFVDREFNEDLGFHGGINPYTLDRILSANTDARAILVTSVTHYGIVTDMNELIDLADKYNMLLLADESHGAHFPFSDAFPKSAIECGADMVLHNAGETLGSMSGGAILHVNNKNIDLDRVRQTIYTYQSPETSNAFLCALENSIYYVNNAAKKYQPLISEIDRCRGIVNDGTDIIWYDDEEKSQYSIHDCDKTRIVINFAKIGMSGKEAAALLRGKYSIEPEFAEKDNVIFVASIFNSQHDIRKLMSAIMSIYKGFLKKNKEPVNPLPYIPNITENISLVCAPAKVRYCQSNWIVPGDVRGCVCKQTIYTQDTYIPLIIPGERISERHLESLDDIIDDGGTICGVAQDQKFEVVDMAYEYSL